MQVREATADDLPGILAIYNEVIANTTAIYNYDPVDLADRAAWFEGRREAGFPVLVAEDGGAVAGYASFGAWRASYGYFPTVEHSVHVRADRRGQGVGRALMEALIERARAMDKHVMIGGIDADNAASIALHTSLGFERVALHREVARKFGRWLDLV